MGEQVFKMYITQLTDILKQNWWPDILEEYQDKTQVFFQGERFQPSKMIIESLRNKAVNYKKGDAPIDLSFQCRYPGLRLPLSHGSYNYKYSDNESFEKDINFIVKNFCMQEETMYGGNEDHLYLLNLDGCKKVMKTLKQKYKIEDNRETGTMLSADTLTIYRLVRCFPDIVCNLFHKNEDSMETPKVSCPRMDFFSGKSRALLSPAFASCIPPEWIDLENNVHLQFFLIYVLVDEKKFKEKTLGVEMLFDHYLYTYLNPVLSSLERKEYCKSIGLANEKGDGFNEDILKKNAAAEYFIRCEKEGEQNLNMVIRKLKSLKEIPEDQD